jgi:hypothetical protein
LPAAGTCVCDVRRAVGCAGGGVRVG